MNFKCKQHKYTFMAATCAAQLTPQSQIGLPLIDGHVRNQ